MADRTPERPAASVQRDDLVVAARAYRDLPPMIFVGSDHMESDEISCSCGFVSQAADYEAARASLRRHIRRKTEDALAERNAIVERFDKALSEAEAVDG